MSGYHFFAPTVFTMLSAALALLLPLLMSYTLFVVGRRWWQLKSRGLKFIFAGLIIFYFILWFAFFPGFLGYDDGVSLTQVIKGRAWGWQSLTYSFFLSSGLILFGNVSWPATACVGIFIYLLGKVFAWLDQFPLKPYKKVFLGILLAVLAAHPLNQGLLLYHSRDTLFSLVLVFLGLQLFAEKPPGFIKMVALTLILVAVGDLRQEAKIYLVLMPVLFCLLKKWGKRQLQIFALVGVLFGLFYYRWLPKYFEVDSYSFAYQVTAYVLPLSQIFHEKTDAEISPEIRADIDRVFDVEKLRKYFNPLDIDPFHQGGFRYSTNAEEMGRFKAAAHKLFLQNPGLFLNNRYVLFKTMLNLGVPWPLFFMDTLRTEPERFPEFVKALKLENNPYVLSPFEKRYVEALSGSINNEIPLRRVFVSYMLPILFLGLCLLFVFWDPLMAAFALFIGIRLPVIFLLAPASYLKYIYSLFLFFTFGLVIFLARRWADKFPTILDSKINESES